MQNFHRPTTKLKTTLRVRALVVLRNLPLLQTLLRRHWLAVFLYGSATDMQTPALYVDWLQFRFLGKVLRRALLKAKRFFWRFNLLPALRYWAFYHLEHSLSENTLPILKWQVTQTPIYNLYYTPVRMPNFGLINKSFRQVLFVFLLLLLPLWPTISRRFVFKTQFLSYTLTLTLLPYYNTKIFKIHYL